MECAADDGPGGEPGDFFGGHAVEAKGDGGGGGVGEEFDEEIEFLRGKFGEAVEPELGGSVECGVRNAELGIAPLPGPLPTRSSRGEGGGMAGGSVGFIGGEFSEGLRSEIEEVVGVLELVGLEPGEVIAEEGGEVVQFETEAFDAADFLGELGEGIGGELVALEFAEDLAEVLGETIEAGAGAEKFEFVALLGEQTAQNHEAAFLIEHSRRGFLQLSEDELRETLEGKDVEARVAGDGGVGEKLALQLISGLLGGEEEQGRPVGRGGEGGANFGEAAKRLAGAGGAEEEARLHGLVLDGKEWLAIKKHRAAGGATTENCLERTPKNKNWEM